MSVHICKVGVYNIEICSFRFQDGEGGDRPTSRTSQNQDGQGQDPKGVTSSTSGNVGQNRSKTTSAPTSPLKEKKGSFFGKVSKTLPMLTQMFLVPISLLMLNLHCSIPPYFDHVLHLPCKFSHLEGKSLNNSQELHSHCFPSLKLLCIILNSPFIFRIFSFHLFTREAKESIFCFVQIITFQHLCTIFCRLRFSRSLSECTRTCQVNSLLFALA